MTEDNPVQEEIAETELVPTGRSRQEVVSLLSQSLAQGLVDDAQKEIEACREITFDPVSDIKKIDNIVAIAEKKLAWLAALDAEEEIKSRLSEETALLETDGEAREVKLETESYSFKDVMAAEKLIQQTISGYSRLITDNLRQRRLLSGQWLGDRANQTKALSGIKLTRTIQLSGEQLVKDLGWSKGMQLTPREEMEMVGGSLTLTQTHKTVTTMKKQEAVLNFNPIVEPDDEFCSEVDEDAY